MTTLIIPVYERRPENETAKAVPKETPPKALRDKYEWKKVEAPKRWNPYDPGAELCGFYGGKTTRSGTYGQYEVVLIHIPDKGTFMVSGVRIVQLVDSSGVEVGWPVRVTYRGVQTLSGFDKKMKLYDFFVAEGEPVSPESLPKIKE